MPKLKFRVVEGNLTTSYIEAKIEKIEAIYGASFIVIPSANEQDTKSSAINPMNGERLPIWNSSDYAEVTVGLPAHNKRDYDFAKKHELMIRQVIAPIFYGKGNDTLLPNKTISRRRNVSVIVKHPTLEEYIGLEWNMGWHSFVIGGIEKGEEPEEAAIREVREETGYCDVKSVYPLDLAISANRAYLVHKDVNGYRVHYPIILELNSLEQVKVEEAEVKNHKYRWIKKEDLKNFMNLDNQNFMLDVLLNGPKPVGLEGELVNSMEFNGLDNEEALVKIMNKLNALEQFNKIIKVGGNK